MFNFIERTKSWNYLSLCGSLATLLQWGAMDANAYPERSTRVLLTLWELASPVHVGHESEWLRPRATAFNSLSLYEVGPDFSFLFLMVFFLP